MIAYYFRVVSKGEPTGWYGKVFAENRQQLFWVIDEFVDPYSVEIKAVKFGGYCLKIEYFAGEDGDLEIEEKEFEFSDHYEMYETINWKKPNWEGCGL